MLNFRPSSFSRCKILINTIFDTWNDEDEDMNRDASSQHRSNSDHRWTEHCNN